MATPANWPGDKVIMPPPKTADNIRARVDISSRDFIEGRDPVLETILGFGGA